jgi:hypothetical protein
MFIREYDCATGTNNPDHPMGGGYSVAAKTPAPSLKKIYSVVLFAAKVDAGNVLV